MPRRSKVAVLPEELRNEVEHRILERHFSGYEEIAVWLQAQGHQIAHDSIQRYAANLRRKRDAMENATGLALALRQAGPDLEASSASQAASDDATFAYSDLLALLTGNAGDVAPRRVSTRLYAENRK